LLLGLKIWCELLLETGTAEQVVESMERDAARLGLGDLYC